MTKARFYIKDKVQKVGYRVHIIQKILNSGLNGTAINLADGRVEVRLEGEKERMIEFYEEFKKEKPELAKNSEYQNLEFNADLMVPDSMRSSQALMLEQLSKGIVYVAGMKESMDGMKESMDGMKGEMREGFKNLPKEIAKELKEVLK
ncbi:MAG: acylphosphatase [Euryarchaeota archaeon]|nr:acylphosphatase [Euryarchaeota archaeon]